MASAGNRPRQTPRALLALVRSGPRLEALHRAISILAAYLHSGHELDLSGLRHHDRLFLGRSVLILETITGPRGPIRASLVVALHSNDDARLSEWLTTETARLAPEGAR